MTISSYKFWSVHRDNSEHLVEHTGHSAGDAAKRFSRSDHRCIRLLDANPKSRNPRKLMWYRPGHEVNSTPDTAIAQGMMQARMSTAGMLLRDLEKRGIRLELKEEEIDDLITTTIIARPKCSPEDYNLIKDNNESLIALLKDLKESTKNPPPSPNPKPVEPEKIERETPPSGNHKDLVKAALKLLPPRSFQFYEVQQQLHKMQQHELADSETLVRQLLADEVLRGELECVKEGVFRVPGQQALDIDNKAPPEPPKTQPASPPPPPSPPTAPPVAAPEAEAPLSNGNGLANPLELIAGLVGSLAATPIDPKLIASALGTLSTELMESVDKFERTIRPMIDQLNAQDNARRYLREISTPAN